MCLRVTFKVKSLNECEKTKKKKEIIFKIMDHSKNQEWKKEQSIEKIKFIQFQIGQSLQVL